MVDHPAQLPLISQLRTQSGGIPPLVFVKIDMGYHRAGVPADSPVCNELVTGLLGAEADGLCALQGLYAHAGHSYYTRQDWEAMNHLSAELLALQNVARAVRAASPGHGLVLSVGATPTATSIQHPDFAAEETAPEPPLRGVLAEPTGSLQALFGELQAAGFELEVHAGVYPTLDLQQLATHARDASLLSIGDVAITVMVEVASLYERRGSEGTTEALINAGCLAMGREPCADKGPVPGQHYGGWGIVSDWRVDNPIPGPQFPAIHGGWQVGRISQEHGILTWQGKKQDEVPLEVGQRLRIWPNHACIAGAGFDYYLIVDSRNKGKEDEIVDVWPRWRGW